jgi:hypothetical protein
MRMTKAAVLALLLIAAGLAGCATVHPCEAPARESVGLCSIGRSPSGPAGG